MIGHLERAVMEGRRDARQGRLASERSLRSMGHPRGPRRTSYLRGWKREIKAMRAERRLAQLEIPLAETVVG